MGRLSPHARRLPETIILSSEGIVHVGSDLFAELHARCAPAVDALELGPFGGLRIIENPALRADQWFIVPAGDAAAWGRQLAEHGPAPAPVRAQSFDEWLKKTATLLEEAKAARR